MEMRLHIPFQQLLEIVKTLSPSQKEKLRKKLGERVSASKEKDEFIDFLLKGPVYTADDIKIIEENRKSISAWRTAS